MTSLALSQAVLLLIALVVRTPAGLPTRALAALAAVHGCQLGLALVSASMLWHHTFALAIGPLLYLHVLGLTGRWFPDRRVWVLHLLPWSVGASLAAWQTQYAETSSVQFAAAAIAAASLATYLHLASSTLIAYETRVSAMAPCPRGRVRLLWLWSLVAGHALLAVWVAFALPHPEYLCAGLVAWMSVAGHHRAIHSLAGVPGAR